MALEGVVATIRHYSKAKKAQTELQETGELSQGTAKELQEAEAEINSFADLEKSLKESQKVDFVLMVSLKLMMAWFLILKLD